MNQRRVFRVVMMVMVIVMGGCTPEAKSAADVGIKIAGAACALIGKDNKFAKFACDVIDAGSSVIAKDGTGAQPYERPKAPAHFEIEVPIAEAEQFAKDHPAK
jgi:hypothetical protein